MQKVKMLDPDDNEIEVDIDWNDENIFECSNNKIIWKVKVLVRYNKAYDYRFIFGHGETFKFCRQIKKKKRVPKEFHELPNPALMWVRMTLDSVPATVLWVDPRSKRIKLFVEGGWLSMGDLEKSTYTLNPQAKEPKWESFWKED